MTEELDRRLKVEDNVNFNELVPEGADKYDLMLSFTSLLEMIKMQDIDATQKETYGDIIVAARGRREGENNVQ